MSDLEKKIEKLILEKKELEKANFKKTNDNLFITADQMIALKEQSALIARQKRDGLIAKNDLNNTNQVDPVTRLKSLEEVKDKVTKNELESIQNATENNVINKSHSISKNELFETLQNAKNAHKRQMAYVRFLIKSGKFHDTNATYPIDYTTCYFGKWFYKNALILNSFIEYKDIEIIHKKIHDYYLSIYKMFKNKTENLLLKSVKNIFLLKNKKLFKIWLLLKAESNLFNDKICILETKIKDLSDSKFYELKIE